MKSTAKIPVMEEHSIRTKKNETRLSGCVVCFYLLALGGVDDISGASTSIGGTSVSAACAASAAASALAAACSASIAAIAAFSLATATLVLGVFAPLGVGSDFLLFFLPGFGADFLVLFLFLVPVRGHLQLDFLWPCSPQLGHTTCLVALPF